MAGQREAVRFAKGIARLCPSKHADELLRDFCELGFCALAKKASPYPDQQDRLEAQYMEVVGRYRDKDVIRAMPEFLGLAIGAIGKGSVDFFGLVAAELNALDSRMGQFFTPIEVSRMMAEINFHGASDLIKENGFITVQEPAAGAGGMLLAVADVIEEKGFPLETSIWIEATELSRSTFHMCYIQCAARGLAGRITHGNSLSGEVYETSFTAAAHLFYDKHGDPFAKQREQAAIDEEKRLETEKRIKQERAESLADLAASPAPSGEQLSLF